MIRLPQVGLIDDANGKVEAPLAMVTKAGISPSGTWILIKGPLIASGQ
jgi:hypothetical protein